MAVLWILAGLAALWLLAMAGTRRMAGAPALLRCRYAHRGLHDLSSGVPENSMPAFRRAAAQGFGAELDIHLTRDGRLAVLHDSSLRRACGVDAAVEDLTAAELGAYRLFGTDETIPFLPDILPLFEGRGPLLIELKTHRNNGRALAAALCKALEGTRTRVLTESFDPRALRALRHLRPDLPRGQLSKNFLRDGGLTAVWGVIPAMLWANFLSRPDFIAYRYRDRRALPLRLCRRLWGVAAFYWTVTTPEALQETEAAGAAAIFEGFVPAAR